MFTGIVQERGRLERRDGLAGGSELWTLRSSFEDLVLGESVAVNGVCLTVTRLEGALSSYLLSPETLGVTALGSVVQGAALNLERSVRAQDRLSGHWVQGHVDGVGRIAERQTVGDCFRFKVSVPEGLLKYCVTKGSISVEGVSLTLNQIFADGIEFMVIPHTATHTTLATLELGARVNLEVDVLAKYVHQYTEGLLQRMERI